MNNVKNLYNISKDLCVLYVEDDLDIQERTSIYFSKFFKELVLASDGEEGLSLYSSKDFDIVITDILMPKMDGIKMLEEIHKINPNQIALITTAHTDSEHMLCAIKGGIDGYIVKPFDFEQMNATLFKVAQKIQMFKENETYKSHLNEIVDEKTHELEDLLVYQETNYQKTLSSMVEIIEQRDTYTAGHSKRVAEYSQKIAEQMGYSQADCTLIYHAGILHDVGKIATPDAVLLNPKSLNDLEYKSRNTIAQALVELEKLSGLQFDPLVAKNAIIALKDVVIDENINQLPQSKLEEERFAYFYKDTLSEAYNQEYLDVVLMKNEQGKYVSEYNKKNGWEKGDKLLAEVASLLSENFPDSYLFRVFGDDFVLMSKECYKEEKIEAVVDGTLKKHKLKYQLDSIDLQEEDISKISQIETLQKTIK